MDIQSVYQLLDKDGTISFEDLTRYQAEICAKYELAGQVLTEKDREKKIKSIQQYLLDGLHGFHSDQELNELIKD